jgi:hypothetical protein
MEEINTAGRLCNTNPSHKVSRGPFIPNSLMDVPVVSQNKAENLLPTEVAMHKYW